MPNLDDLYEQWKGSQEGQPRDDLRDKMFAAALELARAVIWSKLQETNEELSTRIAEDAIGELATFRGESKFSTWVFAIAKTRTKQEMRSRTRHRRVFDPRPIPADDQIHHPRWEPDLDRGIALRQLAQDLPPKDLLLLDEVLKGKDQTELARALNITPSAAESQRRRMAKKMEKKVRPK